MFPSLSFTSSSRCPDKKADVAKEVAGLTLSDVENVAMTILSHSNGLKFVEHLIVCFVFCSLITNSNLCYRNARVLVRLF